MTGMHAKVNQRTMVTAALTVGALAAASTALTAALSQPPTEKTAHVTEIPLLGAYATPNTLFAESTMPDINDPAPAANVVTWEIGRASCRERV